MDRNLLRKLAKIEFKKMMKGQPKGQRAQMTFAQAFPILKSMLKGKMGANAEMNSNQPTIQQAMSAEDAALLEGMMAGAPVTAEHVHGPDCHHGNEEMVEAEIVAPQTNVVEI